MKQRLQTLAQRWVGLAGVWVGWLGACAHRAAQSAAKPVGAVHSETKPVQRWRKRLGVLGVLLMLSVGMHANAGWFGLGDTTWKEEVLLHDGSKIIVDRTAERYGRHEIGQRPPIGNQSLSFDMPDGKKRVAWKDEFSQDLGGASFNLMALDVVRGAAYLIATPVGCQAYNKWGRPNPPYVVFKSVKDEWVRIDLQELPTEIRQPNMLQSSADEVAEKRARAGVVSVAVIRDEREGYKQPEFRTILREPMAISPCPQYSASPKAPS